MRQHVPANEKLYTWWSYRAKDWEAADRGRRLDHIWSSQDLGPHLQRIDILKRSARLGTAVRPCAGHGALQSLEPSDEAVKLGGGLAASSGDVVADAVSRSSPAASGDSSIRPMEQRRAVMRMMLVSSVAMAVNLRSTSVISASSDSSVPASDACFESRPHGHREPVTAELDAASRGCT